MRCIIKITEIISIEKIYAVVFCCHLCMFFSFSWRGIYISGYILLLLCQMVVRTLCVLLMLFVTIKKLSSTCIPIESMPITLAPPLLNSIRVTVEWISNIIPHLIYWACDYCSMLGCRIWSLSPMPCEKHGPRDSVDKNRGRRPRFLS